MPAPATRRKEPVDEPRPHRAAPAGGPAPHSGGGGLDRHRIVVAVLATAIAVLRLDQPHQRQCHGRLAMPTVGQFAPDGGFTTRTGTSSTVASLRGQPTLLWFVVTSCPSVQASMPVMTQRMAAFRTAKVKVVVVEAYPELGAARRPLPSSAKRRRRQLHRPGLDVRHVLQPTDRNL